MSNVPGSPITPPPYWSPTGGPPASMYARTSRRPGIVTGIGVASIVVASLSLLGGLVGGLWTLTMYRMNRMVTNQASSVTAANTISPPLTALPSPEDLEAEAAGLRQVRSQRREGVVELIAAVRPMSPAARRQLDGMLARHAERILPAKVLTDDEVSTADIRAAIASAGSLPGDSDGSFIAFKGTGRLELYGDRAVFIPSGGGGRLRTSGPATPAEEDAAVAAAPPATKPPGPADQTNPPGATPPAAPNASAAVAAGPATTMPALVPGQWYPSGLTGSQVQQVVQRAQQASGGKLNAAQVAGLTAALQNQNPPLVKPQQVWSPIRLAQVAPDGSATVWCSDGMVFMDSFGTVTQQMTNNLQEVTIDPIGMTLLIGEAVVSGLLSIFLLTAGIMVLRNSCRGAGLHWIYLLLKLPLAVLGAVAFAWVMSDLMSGVGRMGGGGRADGMQTFAAVMGLAAATYPIVLIFVLRTRTVREFYEGERAAAGG